MLTLDLVHIMYIFEVSLPFQGLQFSYLYISEIIQMLSKKKSARVLLPVIGAKDCNSSITTKFVNFLTLNFNAIDAPVNILIIFYYYSDILINTIYTIIDLHCNRCSFNWIFFLHLITKLKG